jgi:hypothetical protein
MHCGVPVKTAFTLATVLVGCFFVGFPQESPKPSAASASNNQATILVGAGDIADCRDLSGAEATAKLLDPISGTVMAIGDLAYPDGSKENFTCYDKTWGRAKFRTVPLPAITSFILPAPHPTSIILAQLPVIRRPATTATNSELGTSSC